MPDQLWTLLGLLGVALVPVLLKWQEASARRADRNADREDRAIVAAQVKEAAEAAKAVKVTLAETTTVTVDKLDKIHTLVDGNMTLSKQAEYDAQMGQLALMREVIDLKRAARQEPSVSTLAAVVAMEAKTEVLRKELDERLKQVRATEGPPGETTNHIANVPVT